MVRAGLTATVAANWASAEVNGAPSCQVAFGRSFQVVSMRPSGSSFHPPFSSVGSDSARTGRVWPWLSTTPRPAFRSCSTSRTPATRPPPAELMASTRVNGSPRMAARMRLGAAVVDSAVVALDCGSPRCVGLAQATRRTARLSKLAEDHFELIRPPPDDAAGELAPCRAGPRLPREGEARYLTIRLVGREGLRSAARRGGRLGRGPREAVRAGVAIDVARLQHLLARSFAAEGYVRGVGCRVAHDAHRLFAARHLVDVLENQLVI